MILHKKTTKKGYIIQCNMPCVFPYRPEVPNGDQCFSTKYGYFPILAKGPPCLVVHRPLTSTSSLLNKPGEVEFVKRLVVSDVSFLFFAIPANFF